MYMVIYETLWEWEFKKSHYFGVYASVSTSSSLIGWLFGSNSP